MSTGQFARTGITIHGESISESSAEPELAELIRFHQANNNLFFNGDPSLDNWAHDDQVTLHGGFDISGCGWEVLEKGLTMAASRLSEGQMTFKPMGGAIVGDLAYLSGFEEGTVRLDGGERTEMKLRVTTIFHRTHGRWVCVHRHGEMVR